MYYQKMFGQFPKEPPKTLKVLIVDIGNTEIKFGIFHIASEELLFFKKIKTNRFYKEDYFIKLLKQFYDPKIKRAFVGSVVSEITRPMISAVKKVFEIFPDQIRTGMTLGLGQSLEDPVLKGRGHDLIALAEYAISKAPNCLVFSYGTAMVGLNIVQNRLVSCSIAPGIGIATEALISKASKLKKFSPNIKKITRVGSDTISALESGLFHYRKGFILSFIDELQSRFSKVEYKYFLVGGEAVDFKINDSIQFEILEEATLLGYFKIFLKNNISLRQN